MLTPTKEAVMLLLAASSLFTAAVADPGRINALIIAVPVALAVIYLLQVLAQGLQYVQNDDVSFERHVFGWGLYGDAGKKVWLLYVIAYGGAGLIGLGIGGPSGSIAQSELIPFILSVVLSVALWFAVSLIFREWFASLERKRETALQASMGRGSR